MTILKEIIFFAVALALSGCGKPTKDNTKPQSDVLDIEQVSSTSVPNLSQAQNTISDQALDCLMDFGSCSIPAQPIQRWTVYPNTYWQYNSEENFKIYFMRAISRDVDLSKPAREDTSRNACTDVGCISDPLTKFAVYLGYYTPGASVGVPGVEYVKEGSCKLLLNGRDITPLRRKVVVRYHNVEHKKATHLTKQTNQPARLAYAVDRAATFVGEVLIINHPGVVGANLITPVCYNSAGTPLQNSTPQVTSRTGTPSGVFQELGRSDSPYIKWTPRDNAFNLSIPAVTNPNRAVFHDESCNGELRTIASVQSPHKLGGNFGYLPPADDLGVSLRIHPYRFEDQKVVNGRVRDRIELPTKPTRVWVKTVLEGQKSFDLGTDFILGFYAVDNPTQNSANKNVCIYAANQFRGNKFDLNRDGKIDLDDSRFDINRDGKLNSDDYFDYLKPKFWRVTIDSHYSRDVNGDGVANDGDLLALKNKLTEKGLLPNSSHTQKPTTRAKSCKPNLGNRTVQFFGVTDDSYNGYYSDYQSNGNLVKGFSLKSASGAQTFNKLYIKKGSKSQLTLGDIDKRGACIGSFASIDPKKVFQIQNGEQTNNSNYPNLNVLELSQDDLCSCDAIHNELNPFDVDDNGKVTKNDFDVLVHALRSNREEVYKLNLKYNLDVNGDGDLGVFDEIELNKKLRSIESLTSTTTKVRVTTTTKAPVTTTTTPKAPVISVFRQDIYGKETLIVSGDNAPSVAKGTMFGDTPISQTSTNFRFRIRNQGNADLRLTGTQPFTISGTHSSEFEIVGLNLTRYIGAGESIDFLINFKPKGLGNRSAFVVVESNDAKMSRFYFAITGRGLAPLIRVAGNNTVIPDGDRSPSATDGTNFGTQATGGGRLARSFSITNTGTSILYLIGDRVTITGPHAADFSLLNESPSYVEVGKTRNLEIAFTPTGVGARSAIITIKSSAIDFPSYDFMVTGIGAVPNPAIRGTGNSVEIAHGDPLNVKPHQNPHLRFDVDNNGCVQALDALAVTNAISRGIVLNSANANKAPYYDVNGDSKITSTDALQVLNAISRGAECSKK